MRQRKPVIWPPTMNDSVTVSTNRDQISSRVELILAPTRAHSDGNTMMHNDESGPEASIN